MHPITHMPGTNTFLFEPFDEPKQQTQDNSEDIHLGGLGSHPGVGGDVTGHDLLPPSTDSCAISNSLRHQLQQASKASRKCGLCTHLSSRRSAFGWSITQTQTEALAPPISSSLSRFQ